MPALTKDGRIHTNKLERRALIESQTAAFILARADLSGEQMVEAILAAMPRIRRTLRRFDVSLIASVSTSGGVTVRWAGGVQLESPKALK